MYNYRELLTLVNVYNGFCGKNKQGFKEIYEIYVENLIKMLFVNTILTLFYYYNIGGIIFDIRGGNYV